MKIDNRFFSLANLTKASLGIPNGEEKEVEESNEIQLDFSIKDDTGNGQADDIRDKSATQLQNVIKDLRASSSSENFADNMAKISSVENKLTIKKLEEEKELNSINERFTDIIEIDKPSNYDISHLKAAIAKLPDSDDKTRLQNQLNYFNNNLKDDSDIEDREQKLDLVS